MTYRLTTQTLISPGRQGAPARIARGRHDLAPVQDDNAMRGD